ncbi:MAG: mevalonate kinase [Thermoplasmatota archaeon]
MRGLEDLRAVCSAPGKVILFGEHAVVYGHPAIATAVDLRTTVEVDRCGDRFTVNGFRIHERYHSYLLKAVDLIWQDRDDPIRLQTEGGVPSASGTGSSAALTVAAVGALHKLQGSTDLEALAKAAYRVERATQGGGSPTDTSASTAGGGIAIAGADRPPAMGEHLWTIEHEEKAWAVERLRMPELTVVVGNSGVRGRTDAQVAKVARAVAKNVVVRDALGEIGDITRDGAKALASGDLEAVGRLMDRNHGALHTLGVNHPAVQKLVEAVREAPGTLGAKITGSGGGGSILTLTENPKAAAAAVEAAGGTPYLVKLGGPGVDWEALRSEELKAAMEQVAATPLPADAEAAFGGAAEASEGAQQR